MLFLTDAFFFPFIFLFGIRHTIRLGGSEVRREGWIEFHYDRTVYDSRKFRHNLGSSVF